MAADNAMRGSAPETILVAVSGGEGAERAVALGRTLSDALGQPWSAVHVETPTDRAGGVRAKAAGEALALAARLGANVAKVPAASIADGLLQQLEGSTIGHVVLGHCGGRARLPWQSAILDRIAEARPDLVLHVVPATQRGRPRRLLPAAGRASLRAYGAAAAMVAATLLVALMINRFAGVRALSILFLFPVIAAAARLGIGPAIGAALMSAAAYNLAFLEPVLLPKPGAIQSWLMAVALGVVGAYTGAMTATLRGRLALSDRSARENADIAAFASRLTAVSDWTSTAELVCEQIGTMLGVQTIVLREVEGRLAVVASKPTGELLDAVDQAALEWAWTSGEPAGRGTTSVGASEWQFHPLKTSLGTLALLGLAKADSGDPVSSDKAVLLSTLIAQAALAHERLRLEDDMRIGKAKKRVGPKA